MGVCEIVWNICLPTIVEADTNIDKADVVIEVFLPGCV